jgi:hypothetical protein
MKLITFVLPIAYINTSIRYLRHNSSFIYFYSVQILLVTMINNFYFITYKIIFLHISIKNSQQFFFTKCHFVKILTLPDMASRHVIMSFWPFRVTNLCVHFNYRHPVKHIFASYCHNYFSTTLLTITINRIVCSSEFLLFI